MVEHIRKFVAKLATFENNVVKYWGVHFKDGEEYHKPISPIAFVHQIKTLEDKTRPADKEAIIKAIVTSRIKHDFNKRIDLNSLCKRSPTVLDGYVTYAEKNGIKLPW